VKPNDLSRSLVAFGQASTFREFLHSQVPDLTQQPLKMRRSDPDARRPDALAFEAGRHGFWLARWLRA